MEEKIDHIELAKGLIATVIEQNPNHPNATAATAAIAQLAQAHALIALVERLDAMTVHMKGPNGEPCPSIRTFGYKV